jgi:hypothetical protein
MYGPPGICIRFILARKAGILAIRQRQVEAGDRGERNTLNEG